MEYTINNFRNDFKNDDSCLEYIFKIRFGDNFNCPKCAKNKFYRVKKRRCYACAWCGYQIFPTAGTIFHKSSIKLTDWFFAIYLISKSDKKISAKDLQNHLGVSYKTAWNMKEKIKQL